jgi:hypothetical protein
LKGPDHESTVAMKIHMDFEMTPDEARKLMGLPDVTELQQKLVGEMEKRMMAALDKTADPEAMLKAWFTWGNQGMEQFQRFVRDAGTPKTRSR